MDGLEEMLRRNVARAERTERRKCGLMDTWIGPKKRKKEKKIVAKAYCGQRFPLHYAVSFFDNRYVVSYPLVSPVRSGPSGTMPLIIGATDQKEE